MKNNPRRGDIIRLMAEELGDEPKWHHVIPYGEKFFAADDSVKFDDKFFSGIIKRFSDAGLHLQTDYNHLSTRVGGKRPTREEGAASGWVKDLEVRDDGLYALIDWTHEARADIRSGKYKYLSPEFVERSTDKETGKTEDIAKLLAVALVNRPFLDNQVPLAASDPEGESLTAADEAGKEKVKQMEEKLEAALARIAELEAKLAEAVAKLGENSGTAMADAIADKDKAVKELADHIEATKVAMIDRAQEEKRITPAQAASVKLMSDNLGDNVKALSDILEGFAPSTNPDRDSDAGTQGVEGAAAKLNAEEAEVLEFLDIDPKDAIRWKDPEQYGVRLGSCEIVKGDKAGKVVR